MDRQVEIVAGNHVAVRVAGALVLVAHREPGRVHTDSPAMRAAEALAQLVVQAREQVADGPGRLVAREATRWLIRDAEQISPRPIELGILSPADHGGLAIFLHGGVTALLSGARGVEHYRGVDAAFTVDRVAEPPERAAALFIDDDPGRIPDLPERGIGSLVEGVAPAAGAIVWFEGERTRARNGLRHSGGAHRRAESAESPESAIEMPTDAPRSQPRPRGPVAHTRPEAQPRQAVSSVPEQPDTAAAAPDPELERRLEATARATSLSVKVLGFTCARAHPSDPRSAFCTVCGMPVDQTQQPAEVIRPPLGVLLLDDGMSFLLAADAVLGRDPDNSEPARRGLVPLRVEDASGGMSRAHAEIHLVNWDVMLVDRGSTNGTRARPPGYRDWIRLPPNQPLALVHGAEIMLGNRVLRFEPAAPPPFG
ncbi:FHA domain-containing protein [Nocardia sp. CDC159]|uniref:FHA domain-containing protein n=1 Tax=Nocardia pulmonis TaxID=2951408 RepID=A0A9X2E8A9_9NOCA|nr:MULTISPECIES: FHA domain-containing protein [Nocardia]MCM6776144.1 FHA domain-containing protein [Nocardia pulmonis]MCM6788529.1 FHA domain-containing protein [Nocardia sp. CDC159]